MSTLMLYPTNSVQQAVAHLAAFLAKLTGMPASSREGKPYPPLPLADASCR